MSLFTFPVKNKFLKFINFYPQLRYLKFPTSFWLTHFVEFGPRLVNRQNIYCCLMCRGVMTERVNVNNNNNNQSFQHAKLAKKKSHRRVS